MKKYEYLNSVRKLTDEELMKYYRLGFIDKEVAKMFNCSAQNICKRRHKLGLVANGMGYIKKNNLSSEECKESYKNVLKQIANHHNRILKTIEVPMHNKIICSKCGKEGYEYRRYVININNFHIYPVQIKCMHNYSSSYHYNSSQKLTQLDYIRLKNYFKKTFLKLGINNKADALKIMGID